MRLLSVAVVAGALALTPSLAQADSIIRQANDHPDYHIEIEPHGILAWPDWYGGFGYYGFFGIGGGARFSVPICKNCFIPKINNNVAISFGADLAIFPFGPGYAPSYLYLPVAIQWNFFVSHKWSIGPEVGFTPVIGVFYDYGACDRAGAFCHNWYFAPSFWAVGRYQFNDHVSLTMRVGYPEFFNVGVSFFL